MNKMAIYSPNQSCPDEEVFRPCFQAHFALGILDDDGKNDYYRYITADDLSDAIAQIGHYISDVNEGICLLYLEEGE